ncbi:MAG: insulinase family protein [Candidatus Methanogranum gryphiswaldense]|nr:MAG: insulinase family protein [Candidatus Methanogranum sp. U3.2.1]
MSENTINISKTDGGIPVVTELIPGCESSGYMVAIGTGSRDETKDIFGISHLLEHVVFRETKNRTSYQMSKEMEGAGGELNAFTGRELTAFFGITIKETKNVAKEMVSDIVANPMINDNDVELEKKVVLQELSMVKNEPEAYIHDLFAQNMWRGHPLCQDEGGSIDVVKSLGSKELRAYYEERYGIPNIAVFAAGNIESEDTVMWASEKFDGMAGKKVIKREVPKRPDMFYGFVKNDSDHYHVAMGLPSYGPNDKNRIPALLLNTMIGAGTSSRLFQEVREKRALVYSVNTTVEQYCDAASIVAYMSCTDENVIKAIETTAKVFSQIKSEGLQEGELIRTKRLLKGAYVRSMESTEHRMYRLGRDYMLNGKCQTLESRLAAVEDVTEEQVMHVANDLLRSNSLNVTVLGKGNREIKKFDLAHVDI